MIRTGPNADEYFLARHVHICTIGELLVVLDLASSKYLSLELPEAAAPETWVKGWPFRTTAAADRNTLQLFLDRGLLTADRRLGKVPTPPQVSLPSATLLDLHIGAEPRIRTADAIRFLWAFARASLGLRAVSMQRIVGRVSRRRRRNARSHAIDLLQMRKLLAVFEKLRPFAFAAKDTCLLYSLTLLEFLACYRIYPDWIFGVRRPFAAHCWVQAEGYAVSCTAFDASGFTPIMTV